MRLSLLLIAVSICVLGLSGCRGTGTVCSNSGSTSECGDGFICTFSRTPLTFDPNAAPPPSLNVCLRTCNTSTDCGEGELCRFVYCSDQKSCQTGGVQDPPPGLCGCEYEQDFESLDPSSPTALGDDGWLFFGNVSDESGARKFSYPNDPPSPDPAPNDLSEPDEISISALVSEQGSDRQGAQQLAVTNDYGCCALESTDPQGHGNGTDQVDTIVFREINPITDSFIGKVYEFTFDAKRGNIEGASTAQAFIRTLRQQADGTFTTTNDIVLDTSDLPADYWGRYTLSFDMSDPGLQGQRLQFGFSTIASDFEAAGNLYDNTSFCASSVGDGLGGAGGDGGMGGAGGVGGTPPGGTGGTGGGGSQDCASTATAFIKTLDPDSNFNLTNLVEQDTTDLPDTWNRYTLQLEIDAGLEGQLIQFGFSATATNFESSGVFYDNIVVDPSAQYTQDFEALNQMDSAALSGDGWIVFGNAFEADGETLSYPYGPNPAPNPGEGFCAIAAGQGGTEQGANQLSIYSDYANQDQGNGLLIEANTFQERTITAGDVGTTIIFSFDAKRGNINEACR